MKALSRMFVILVVFSILVSGCGAPASATPAAVRPTESISVATLAPVTIQPEPTSSMPGIVAIVPTSELPTMLAAAGDSIWVQSHGLSIVTRIDPSKNQEVERLREVPSHCEVISGGGFVWSSEAYGDRSGGKVTKVDPTSGAVVGSIELDKACGLAANDTDLWVVSPGLGQAVRYDAATLEEKAVIPLDKDVFEIEIGPDAVWASGAANGGTVWRIDPATNQVVTSISLSSSALAGLVVASGSIWVAAGDKGLLFRIDSATNAVTEIKVNNGIGGIATGQDVIWVAGASDGTIYRIDPATNSISGSMTTQFSALGPPLFAFDSLWVPTIELNKILRIDPTFFDSRSSGAMKGIVTIKTKINFNSWPRAGTFEVPEGAEILGCSEGSFVDTAMDNHVQKLLTCKSGPKSGTFTADFNPQEIPGPGDENGPWNIIAATEDFSGLAGGGDFWVVVDESTASGVETLTGEIEYSE